MTIGIDGDRDRLSRGSSFGMAVTVAVDIRHLEDRVSHYPSVISQSRPFIRDSKS
jgi:hypothetical protein